MNDQKKILILFAHPAPHKSRVNQVLATHVSRLTGVTFHDLYAVYPEFDFTVPEEQALLEAHDVIVFQFPFFWYSSPAIVKEWTDLVLTHGWAYGSEGNALKGKWVMHAITTGGRESAYRTEGLNRFTDMERLLLEEAQGHDETRDMGWDTKSLREDIEKMSASDGT